MPLSELYKYSVPNRIKNTKDAEKQIIDLLVDIKDNICFKMPYFGNQRLDAILEKIEGRKWDFQKEVNPRKS